MSLTKEAILEIARNTKHETNVLSGKITDLDKINRIIAMGIAARLAFKVLDVPSDPGIIPRQYYAENLSSIVDEVVSRINEACPIDHQQVIKSTFNVWYQRLLFVRGDMPEKVILDFLEDCPALSKQEQDACDDRIDCLLKG